MDDAPQHTPGWVRRFWQWGRSQDAKLDLIICKLEKIMTVETDLLAAVADLKTEVGDVATEMDSNFAALIAAQAASDPAAVAQATADIRTQIQALKDVAARDAPAPTPTP